MPKVVAPLQGRHREKLEEVATTRNGNYNYWLHAEALIHRTKTRLKMGCTEYENLLGDATKALNMFKVLGNDEGINYASKIWQEIEITPPQGLNTTNDAGK